MLIEILLLVLMMMHRARLVIMLRRRVVVLGRTLTSLSLLLGRLIVAIENGLLRRQHDLLALRSGSGGRTELRLVSS